MADVKKVLVVDDHFEMLELLRSMLELSNEECEVLAVPSAEEGMLELRRTKFDLVITDVRLPGMSGFDLCRSLKRSPETEKVPVVICSSKDQAIDRLWGMRQGADAYITKPFDREELLKVIKSVL